MVIGRVDATKDVQVVLELLHLAVFLDLAADLPAPLGGVLILDRLDFSLAAGFHIENGGELEQPLIVFFLHPAFTTALKLASNPLKW